MRVAGRTLEWVNVLYTMSGSPAVMVAASPAAMAIAVSAFAAIAVSAFIAMHVATRAAIVFSKNVPEQAARRSSTQRIPGVALRNDSTRRGAQPGTDHRVVLPAVVGRTARQGQCGKTDQSEFGIAMLQHDSAPELEIWLMSTA